MNKLQWTEREGKTLLPDNVMEYGEVVHIQNQRHDKQNINVVGMGPLRHLEWVCLRRDVDGTWHGTFYNKAAGEKL